MLYHKFNGRLSTCLTRPTPRERVPELTETPSTGHLGNRIGSPEIPPLPISQTWAPPRLLKDPFGANKADGNETLIQLSVLLPILRAAHFDFLPSAHE